MDGKAPFTIIICPVLSPTVPDGKKDGTKDGKDLFGLMVDGVVRNPIVFSYTGDDNEVDLIDLRKFGRMKNDEEEGEKQVEELND